MTGFQCIRADARFVSMSAGRIANDMLIRRDVGDSEVRGEVQTVSPLLHRNTPKSGDFGIWKTMAPI